MAKTALFYVLCIARILLARGPDGDDGSSKSADPPESSSSSSSSNTLTPTSTSTSASPTRSSATANLTFTQPSNTSTCDSTTFSWVYQGNTIVPLTIQITDSSDQLATDEVGFTESLVSFRTLTTDLPSNADSVVFDPVDIPPGTYTVVAFSSLQAVPVYAQSPPFLISAGEDTSCVANMTTTSTSSPTATSSATSSGTTSSSSKKIDPRALAGAIVGVVGAVVVLGLAFLAPRWLRHHLPYQNRRNVRAGGPYYMF